MKLMAVTLFAIPLAGCFGNIPLESPGGESPVVKALHSLCIGCGGSVSSTLAFLSKFGSD